MSAIFTVHTGSPIVLPDLAGQRVEINHNRELTFPDHDIRYDETLEALGGEKTSFIKLLETWNGENGDEDNFSRIQFIDNYLLISNERLCRLRFDFVHHVSWVYREMNPGVDLLDRAIQMALSHFKKSHTPIRSPHHHHNYFSGAIKVSKKAIEVNSVDFHQHDNHHRVQTRAAERVVRTFIQAVSTLENGPSTFHMSYMSASSVADVLYPDKSHHDPDWYDMFNGEQSWQLRRLVDVGQSWNEKRKWPDIEATP